MFCPNCGNKVEEDDLFCGECGTSLREYREQGKQEDFSEENIRVKLTKETEPDSSFGSPQYDRMQTPDDKYDDDDDDECWCEEAWKPKNKNVSVILSGGILAGVLILFGVFFMIDGCSAKSAVERYWEAKNKCDWSAVYDSIELPEDDMLSRQAFVNAHAEDNEPASYKLIGYTDSGSAEYPAGDDSENISGVSDSYKTNPDSRVYYVEYAKKGSSSASSEIVTAVKTGKKKMFFWDEWKVIPEAYVVKDVQLYVQAGTTVLLNGQDVHNFAEVVSYPGDDGDLTVTIPYLFAGSYQLEVFMEGMEPYRRVLDITCDDNHFQVDDLYPSQDTIERLVQQAADDVQTIYMSILNGQSYETVQSLFREGKENDEAREEYENILTQFREADLIRFAMDQMTVEVEDASVDLVSFTVNFHYSQTYDNGWENVTDEGSSWVSCLYQKEADGTWKLSYCPR